MKKAFTLIIISLLLHSCYSTKHLQTNEYILKNNIITIEKNQNFEDKKITKSEIKTILKQNPNKKILGLIPFHLWIYNISNPNKKNWTNNYLRKIGEKPIIVDTDLIKKSQQQIKSYVENNGFFNSSVTSKILYKKNTANIYYNIIPGSSYLVRNINYDLIQNEEIQTIIKTTNRKTTLINNTLFNYNTLNNERILIEKLLQNNGYYKFSKDLIYFKADSSDKQYIDLDVVIQDIQKDSSLYNKFYINDVFISLDDNAPQLDTIIKDDYYFFTEKNKKTDIKLDILSNLITIKKFELYSKKKAEKTYKNLSNLRFFKKIRIEFIELEGSNKLDCYIYLNSPTKMYYSIEAEAKRSADEGNLGVSGYFQFGNNNLLKGAEKLNGQIRLSLENRQSTIDQSNNLFNTKELFYELRLRFPKLIIPKKFINESEKISEINTNLVFSITQRNRPDFSSQIISQKIGYNWKKTNKTQHQLNLFELSFSDIGQINQFIQNELIENPYLSEQFEDKFIPATNYTFTFNNQKIYKISNYTYLKTKIETAGNLLNTIGQLVNLNTDSDNNYLVFNNLFSQYIRFDIDLRRYLMLSKENILILRGFYGIGYSYGNSKELPIQKQFFSGGVNSIRAWEAFELGPGSITTTNNYSTGDLKLEFNIEYRFPVFNSLKSALFIDGGNIWSIRNDPRDGSIFQLNSFINELAIGTGLGIRYDFDFFVIRLDVATPIRDPSKENRWIKNPLSEKFRYNLAIGYPF